MLFIYQHKESCYSGVGVTKPISSVPLFSEFLVMSKETSAIEYHVYIWQVSLQLSCSDICQIWMWFEESNMYFCHIKNFAYGEINERSFSNPHPSTVPAGGIWKHSDNQVGFQVGDLA